MICCETYKFCERVQLDSICYNELGDPDQMIAVGQGATRTDMLGDWRDIPSLKLLNLVYDLTPMEYVDMVITEVGMTPPTSVPVLIREQSKDQTA
jgi:translation initiation factor eIF-2B subunit delta